MQRASHRRQAGYIISSTLNWSQSNTQGINTENRNSYLKNFLRWLADQKIANKIEMNNIKKNQFYDFFISEYTIINHILIDPVVSGIRYMVFETKHWNRNMKCSTFLHSAVAHERVANFECRPPSHSVSGIYAGSHTANQNFRHWRVSVLVEMRNRPCMQGR